MMATKDYQSHFYQQQQAREQDWSVDRWCRSLKVSRRKIERNPHYKDLATLLMFDSWQGLMTSHDKDIWTHCWQWVYSKELPLTRYHKRKLTGIIDHIELRHTRQWHIEQRRQKRQAKNRASEIENGVKIMTVKGSASQI